MRSLATVTLLVLGLATAVSAQSPLTITTTSLPGAIVGTAYSVQLQTSGATSPVTWSSCPAGDENCVTSGLPPGLTLGSSTGIISGTPTTPGNYTFIVDAVDSDEGYADKELSISVAPCTPTISPSSPLPPGEIGIRYPTVTFAATGCSGSYTYSATSSSFNNVSLPPGLNLSAAGALSGTPTSVGTYPFELNVTDSNQNTIELQYSITINPQPSFKTQSPLPNGFVNVPYSQQIVASGGIPPYVFSMNANPPGITITQSGVLNGTPTQAGTYTFNIGVTDSLQAQTVSSFQVTFTTAVAQVLVNPLALTFNANLGGTAPPQQAISITPATGATQPASFQVIVDSGQNNTPAPSWITVSPTSGDAPAGLVVSANQSSLAAGSYLARIQIVDKNGLATDVAVTLNVASVSPSLTFAPSILNFATLAATPGLLTQSLTVGNAGNNSLAFTTSVAGNSPWITSVTASSNSTTPTAPVFVQVVVNTSGLAVGAYHDAIQFSSSAGNVQIPVSLFVAGSGPVMALNSTGILFQSLQGGGSTETENVNVLNFGAPSSTVNWTASLLSGSNWLNLVSSSGTATATTPGVLSLALAPNATQLSPGAYYAIVQVTDPNSLNAPQYITVVLDLQPASAAPTPDPAAGGLFFIAPAGSSAPPAQKLQINTSSVSTVTFNATASTTDGAPWLSVTPASGTISGQSAATESVSVNPTGLAAGIYYGQLSFSIGASLQSVNITFVVQSGLSNSARIEPHASGCTPSKIAITETSLPNNFAVPAGWPQTLIVQLNDDCGAAITNGSVVASFSNGDQALQLISDTLGSYSATWQPGTSNANMVVALNATAGQLTPATAKLDGGVNPNQTPPPTLAAGGTLNNLNPVVGAPLAPGTITQLYGSNLASSAVSPGVLPLPTNFDNTFALIGSKQAPLYFLSSGQINIQLPAEITAMQQLPIILSVNNALTLPALLNIVPSTPGVLSANDGPTPPNVQNDAHLIAQHSSNYTLVSSSNPAKPGEYLVMYLVGMGATNPSVPSGTPTPSTTLASVTVQPTVTVASQPVTVAFAGLTPGFVGLYQINFQVPTGVASGELEVDVSQNGVAANPTLLPVSQ